MCLLGRWSVPPHLLLLYSIFTLPWLLLLQLYCVCRIYITHTFIPMWARAFNNMFWSVLQSLRWHNKICQDPIKVRFPIALRPAEVRTASLRSAARCWNESSFLLVEMVLKLKIFFDGVLKKQGSMLKPSSFGSLFKAAASALKNKWLKAGSGHSYAVGGLDALVFLRLRRQGSSNPNQERVSKGVDANASCKRCFMPFFPRDLLKKSCKKKHSESRAYVAVLAAGSAVSSWSSLLVQSLGVLCQHLLACLFLSEG